MSPENAAVFSTFGVGVVLTLLVGFYSLLTTRNLVRTLISLEILTKGVTLLILLVGYVSGQVGLAQALAITLIVVEVAVVVVAISIVVCVHKATGTVDVKAVQEIKG
jgi:multisubunit Na+/H+ antiporter MnhC subunit